MKMVEDLPRNPLTGDIARVPNDVNLKHRRNHWILRGLTGV
jgi:hypothetical protein